MAMSPHLLAIDQGTTSTRAITFDSEGRPVTVAQEEFRQLYPRPGWVEHDPEEIWTTTVRVARAALDDLARLGGAALAIGITNQRETTILWERDTGRPIFNAIVWQDRRTATRCAELKTAGAEAEVAALSGLVIDPYFSATKIAWILDHVPDARARAERGELAFGTVDGFLLWRLSGGRVHAVDATNASRTLLYNIRTGDWDDRLLELFGVPRAVMPAIVDSSGDLATTAADLLGTALPVTGMAGDQQAAAIGQACLYPGMIKSTYGTGCFVIENTGETIVGSRNRLLTTVCYQLAGRRTFAVEGAIFVAGAAVQWLRDGLGILARAAETEAMARSLDDNGGVYLVPAFVGLGAPHWQPDARAAIVGLTRDTGRAHLARAALEAVGYQTLDLVEAMAADGVRPAELRIDGGMVSNDWLCQFLADILDLPVDRPAVTETTALGAAMLAGLRTGVWGSVDALAAGWRRERRFEPAMAPTTRDRLIAGWRAAVAGVLSGVGAPPPA